MKARQYKKQINAFQTGQNDLGDDRTYERQKLLQNCFSMKMSYQYRQNGKSADSI
jgi:hypothetical protein